MPNVDMAKVKWDRSGGWLEDGPARLLVYPSPLWEARAAQRDAVRVRQDLDNLLPMYRKQAADGAMAAAALAVETNPDVTAELQATVDRGNEARAWLLARTSAATAADADINRLSAQVSLLEAEAADRENMGTLRGWTLRPA